MPWLGNPRKRDLFLSVLELVRRRYSFVVIGYVVMPEHVHLLIGEVWRAWFGVVNEQRPRGDLKVLAVA